MYYIIHMGASSHTHVSHHFRRIISHIHKYVYNRRTVNLGPTLDLATLDVADAVMRVLQVGH